MEKRWIFNTFIQIILQKCVKYNFTCYFKVDWLNHFGNTYLQLFMKIDIKEKLKIENAICLRDNIFMVGYCFQEYFIILELGTSKVLCLLLAVCFYCEMIKMIKKNL